MTLTTAIGLWGVASAADSTIEVQIPAYDLLSAFVYQAARLGKDCPTVVDAGGVIGEAIVNHVEWPTHVEVQPYLVPGSEEVTVALSMGDLQTVAPVARIPLELHFRELSCVYDPECHPYDTHVVRVWLDYTLTAGPDGLCADYLGTVDPLPQGTADAVADQIERFGRPCVDLTRELEPLLALVGQDDLLDVAMVADPSLEAIVVRASVDDPLQSETLSDWEAFLFGILLEPWDDDGKILIDEGLLQRGFRTRLLQAVSCGADPSSPSCTDGVEPAGGIASDWDDDPATVTAEVEVVGPACGALAGNTLIASSTFDIVTLIPDWANSYYANQVDYLMRVVTELDTSGPAVGCSSVWNAVLDEMDDVFVGLGGECTLSGDEITCEAPFPLMDYQDGPGSNLWGAPWTEFYGDPGGLALHMIWGVGSGPAVPQRLELDGSEAVYDIRSSECRVAAGYEGELEMDGGPGTLCDADDLGLPTPLVLNDTEGVYDLGFGSTVADRTYHLHPTPAFWADPYGPLITVWSTAGAATIQLYEPDNANVPEGIDIRLIRAIVDAWIACHPAYGGLPIPGWFDIEWLVDPPPYEVVVVGDAWQGATAVLETAQIVSSDPVFDARLGLTTANGALMSSTWTVTHPRMGRVGFTVQSVVPVTLAGTEDALTPASAGVLSVAVPRASLPRGVSTMTFDVPLEPGAQMFTPVAR